MPLLLLWAFMAGSWVIFYCLKLLDNTRFYFLEAIFLWEMFLLCIGVDADPSGLTVQGEGLRPLACWACRFESRRGHGYLSLLIVVFCKAAVLPIIRPEESYQL
jgi:hypothetical protein